MGQPVTENKHVCTWPSTLNSVQPTWAEIIREISRSGPEAWKGCHQHRVARVGQLSWMQTSWGQGERGTRDIENELPLKRKVQKHNMKSQKAEIRRTGLKMPTLHSANPTGTMGPHGRATDPEAFLSTKASPACSSALTLRAGSLWTRVKSNKRDAFLITHTVGKKRKSRAGFKISSVINPGEWKSTFMVRWRSSKISLSVIFSFHLYTEFQIYFIFNHKYRYLDVQCRSSYWWMLLVARYGRKHWFHLMHKHLLQSSTFSITSSHKSTSVNNKDV